VRHRRLGAQCSVPRTLAAIIEDAPGELCHDLGVVLLSGNEIERGPTLIGETV
jgi:hypothetical protein